MITLWLIQIAVAIMGIILWPLPTITTLPTIGGYDIDGTLTNGMSLFNAYATAVWPVHDVVVGALVLFGYYGLKMLLKLVIGHRAPGAHG